jgi:hypothetical protein
MMHLPDMLLHENDLLKAKTGYVCAELNCPVSYNALDGYFIAAKEGDRVDQSRTPRVFCPNDKTPMYLAEIHPEHKSYRLWKCPQCSKSLTNLESKQGRE